jgi:hypothetical protein
MSRPEGALQKRSAATCPSALSEADESEIDGSQSGSSSEDSDSARPVTCKETKQLTDWPVGV